LSVAVDRPWLLGASGQVGLFLQRRLGDGVVPCARSVPAWAMDHAARWRLLDLWRSADAPACERLISAGPLDACGDWLARVGPGSLRRIVALSSMSAAHKQASPSPRERDVAQRLQASEQRLSEFSATHGIACTILRPTLIWGAGLDRSLTPFAQAAARRGFAIVPSAARGLRQPVHADDLAALCVALLDRDAAVGVFEAGGGERLALSEMLARAARAVDARLLRLPAPGFALSAIARIAARLGAESGALSRAMQDQCCSDDAIWRIAGLAPRGFEPTRSSFLPAISQAPAAAP
jgi:nucleoside-diphosphate-sugar epimerase